MSWVRLDDNFPHHPKILGISDESFRLHIGAICYASSHQTNGFLHNSVIEFIAHRSKTRTKRMVNQLKDAGLWDVSGAGYAIHDYLDYNPAADELASKREENHRAKAAAGRAGGLAKAASNASKTLAEPSSKTKQILAPAQPVPARPDPIVVAASGRNAEGWFREVEGRGPNAALKQQLSDIDAAHPDTCIDWAFGKSMGKDSPWPYAKVLLDTCMNEPHGPRQRKEQAYARKPAAQKPWD